ncbi:LMBR1-like membrane protein [Hirsutella rhossiliensis]|uniref:LMBR1-like membrane protein n=1 Tax=Hirsutella rhossiliensis TaxID=111463 RepID=A0A9P8N8X3_9HYPO|nr:LMBR1-like membrane protein [Hirsutella rhossiliensis]KAH0966792.1 LMBR1-like membrane protein [Hirsutella rhossiliensis]
MPHALSAATPFGSTLFSLFALLAISLVVLLILRHYLPLRSTPAFYLVPIFFALWLPSIVVILVPIDLASSAATDDEASRGVWLPQRVVLVSWRITYWLTFALTWFILPILGEYSDAGYRDPNDKLRYSLRQNAQFYVACAGAGIAGFVYIAIVYKLTFESLKALVMALAYCWGLVLAIYLMGHGLVSIPRRLIRSASISGSLRRLQSRAPKALEKMQDSVETLQEIVAQVSELGRRKVGSAVDFQDWIEELQEMAGVARNQPPSFTPDTDSHNRIIPTVITEKFLADLTRRLVRARHARSRYADEWNRLIQEASETQAILDSAASKNLDFGQASPHAGPWARTQILTPYARYLCYYHIMPHTRLALGGFLALASACVLWSELVKFPFPKLSVIRLSVIHNWVGDEAQVGFAEQVISALWICYMCAAALISITEVKVWRGRALVKRNTAYESAFWYASQVAKLCMPLSYNFMTFLTSEVYSKTTFYDFLGSHIDFTALGRWFDDLFPIILLVPVFATLFGLYGKVKRLLAGVGLADDEDDDDDEGNPSGYSTASWREGQILIQQELQGNSLHQRREEAAVRLTAANTNGARPHPVLSVPPARDVDVPSARSSPRPSATAPRPGQPSRASYSDEPPEDDNIFQILGHRMKNTIDTIETPQWLQEIGQGIKKPKWMGGDGDVPSSGRGGRSDSDIRRWFGDAGQIRL